MNTTIRPYQPADFKDILELFRLNTPGFFHPDEQSDLVRFLTQEVENYYVLIEGNGRVVACGGNNIKDSIGWLSWYIVHPEYKGAGLGRILVEYNMSTLKKNTQVNGIKVRTSQLVYKFYEKNGFRLQFIEKDFWGKGFDLYEMELH